MLPSAAALPGIPVEHEVFVGDGFEDGGRLFSRGRVAGHFIFQQQDQVALGAGLSGGAQLVVDRGAIGRLILQPPEVEAADAIGFELL